MDAVLVSLAGSEDRSEVPALDFWFDAAPGVGVPS
jgi:hypothetical protein